MKEKLSLKKIFKPVDWEKEAEKISEEHGDEPESQSERERSPSEKISASPKKKKIIKANKPSVPITPPPHTRDKGLLEFLREAIFGQDHLLPDVARLVEHALFGMEPSGKPLASIFLAGPTGTGKTETARMVSKYLEAVFIRVDCSEYSEEYTLSSLLGSPPGYVGYSMPTPLDSLVKYEGYSVLLFDEIEKAHPAIHRALLGGLDSGSIKTRDGKLINLKRSLIFFTSNIGAGKKELRIAGFSCSDSKDPFQAALDEAMHYQKALRETFPPEFLGRLSSFLVYRPLPREVLSLVFDKAMRELHERRGAKRRKVEIRISEAIKEMVIDNAMASGLGARPIEKEINAIVVPKIVSVFKEMWRNGQDRDLENLDDNAMAEQSPILIEID